MAHRLPALAPVGVVVLRDRMATVAVPRARMVEISVVLVVAAQAEVLPPYHRLAAQVAVEETIISALGAARQPPQALLAVVVVVARSVDLPTVVTGEAALNGIHRTEQVAVVAARADLRPQQLVTAVYMAERARVAAVRISEPAHRELLLLRTHPAVAPMWPLCRGFHECSHPLGRQNPRIGRIGLSPRIWWWRQRVLSGRSLGRGPDGAQSDFSKTR